MRLRNREKCPIHGKYYGCCGRMERSLKANPKHKPIAPGVTMITDEHHPRGYRIHRSKSAMRELLTKKVRDQEGRCYWCKKEFQDFREVQADHIEPRGMGAARKDDDESNICASCQPCNLAKGSRRI